MIRNYFQIAWRNLLKNRSITFINITGLSIGVAACLLISLYIIHETNYDKNVPNADNIYRLIGVFNFDGTLRKGTHFSAMMARTLEADFEEIEVAGRLMDNPLFYRAGSNDIRFDGNPMQHHEEGFVYTDQSILDIFDLPFVEGDAATALASPKTMVISQSRAKKFFQNESPLGKTMYLNNNQDDPFTITGVMEDLPSNSHLLEYNYLITLKDVEFGEGEQTRWLQQNYFSYLQVKEGTDIEKFEKKVTESILKNYLIPAMIADGDVLAETLEDKVSLELQPLKKIHLYSSDIFDMKTRGDIKIVWMFGIVALFILLIACINFINLSTAKSANRAKEVGLRKVLGSGKYNLISQFLTESVIVTALSFGLGLVLAYLTLPLFNSIADTQLQIPLESPAFILTLIASCVAIGVLAGMYPSFYLSGFSPINVLKGKVRHGAKSAGLRGGLVVFQFTISIILICGTLVIHKQMNFILNKEVGFSKDQVIQLHSTNVLGDKIQTFKDQIEQLPSVESVSISDYLPITGTKRNGNTFYNEGMEKIEESVSGQAWIIDEDYLATLDIKLLDGRNFTKEMEEDNSVIINQEMAGKLNLENPVGKKLSRYGRLWDIVGIVQDFHFESFREEVRPLALFYGLAPSIMSVKASTEDLPKLIANLESGWNNLESNLEFRYTFMDQSFERMYSQVRKTETIFTSFALLAIFIACLGLFALSAFIVEQRSKEMSIRKVLGASLENIFRLLTKQFLLLVLISLVLAVPIAYVIMSKWLEDFVYRIDMSWMVFLVAGFIALFITLSTISYHAVRTALVNPSTNLRNE